jgi:hypothetical protein
VHGPLPLEPDLSVRLRVPLRSRLQMLRRPTAAGKPRIYAVSFASVYPLYVQKAERKGRTKDEVDAVIRWLTGYSQKALDAHLEKGTDFEAFLAKAQLNPARAQIKGVVCGVRVEDITDPTMQGIRYLDKLVDELAQGKALEKIQRKG